MGKTIARVLNLTIPFHGMLMGRVAEEALPGGTPPAVESLLVRGEPNLEGIVTVLTGQRVGKVAYFDAAGFPGGTVGLDLRKAASR